MTELSPSEIELLEEFREDLAPFVISGMFCTTTLPAELVQTLYKLVCEKITEHEMPAAVKNLKEVS